MGNSLGCVKEPKEKAAGKAPLSPKKRVRFKRKWRGKRKAMPEAAPQEELPALGEDEEVLKKSEAAPGQEGGEDPAGSRHGSGDPDPSALPPGLIVQVKQRFQGEVQKARLVLEPRRAAAAGRAALEEGTTVIARLLDNPAERDCEKAVSRLVQLQRSGTGCCRAVLLPLPGGGTDGPAQPFLFPAREPGKSRELGTGSSLDAWRKGGSNDPSSSTAWTCSSAAEPGTVSELSTPSPMVDQLENPGVGRTSGLSSSRAREGDEHGLLTSCSPSSISAARSSSGYGSDPARRPAKGNGAGRTTASPSEGGHRLTAEGRAWRGSSGTAGGMVSVYVHPHPLFGAGWEKLV
ncbi:uncharacterized protein [Heliangelus exortis]|uniref:uncharacterized protein n=1 Tax=Heliangelus exortis TaxID=472823 RepID=UPI003A8FE2C0